MKIESNSNEMSTWNEAHVDCSFQSFPRIFQPSDCFYVLNCYAFHVLGPASVDFAIFSQMSIERWVCPTILKVKKVMQLCLFEWDWFKLIFFTGNTGTTSIWELSMIDGEEGLVPTHVMMTIGFAGFLSYTTIGSSNSVACLRKNVTQSPENLIFTK